MSFLLDTNVVSEWSKKRPDPGVVAWLDSIDEDRTFLSVVTLAEVRYGIDRVRDAERRDRLESWLRNDLVVRFEGRLLAVDETIAEAWGSVTADGEAVGRRIGAMDACIAATARVHNLRLVTRNVRDFEAVLQDLVNPWTD